MNRILFAMILLGLSAGAGQSDDVQCETVDLQVRAGPEEAGLVCAAATRARDVLAECGLAPDWPVRLTVAEEIEDAPHCIGQFECGTGEITVLSPQALAARDDTAAMFPGMAVSDLFAGLVVHELAHAALYHVTDGFLTDRTTQEYIATAMQFQTISPEDRARFLAAWPVETPAEVNGINQFTLALAPGMFMSRAWLHFSAPENGCAFVAGILDGRVRLGLPEL
jgi:hypothetical protein